MKLPYVIILLSLAFAPLGLPYAAQGALERTAQMYPGPDPDSIINADKIARAEKLIRKYMDEKHPYAAADYQISLYSKAWNSQIVSFMVVHKDDYRPVTDPAPRGGGKSLIIEMDMYRMVIERELGFQ